MPSGKPRILFILKNRSNYFSCDTYPYSTHLSSGLFNSAKFVEEMLASRGYEVGIVHVQDGNGIHREVVKFKADVVIIEAFWVPPYKFDDLKKVLPRVTFVIRNHSDIPFLAYEGMALEWTLEYLKKTNVVMTCNSPQAFSAVRFLALKQFFKMPWCEASSKVAYLPNYYPTAGHLPKKHLVGDPLDVGCFGAIRPLKNQLVQAIAAMKFADSVGKRLRFHINATRIECAGNAVLKNIVSLFAPFPDDSLVMHPWSDHATFLKLVRSMDITLQVSLSETFNIVSADSVVQGVPIVVSDQIAWASSAFKAKVDDAGDIARKMQVAFDEPLSSNIQGLRSYSDTSVAYWEAFLNRF